MGRKTIHQKHANKKKKDDEQKLIGSKKVEVLEKKMETPLRKKLFFRRVIPNQRSTILPPNIPKASKSSYFLLCPP